MPRLNVVTEQDVQPPAKEIFARLKSKLGKVPNIYATVAHSPITLKGILDLGAALKEGVYSLKEIETVALSCAEENQCHYCLAAHTAIGKTAGFSEDETVAIRKGTVSDQKLKVLSALAKDIVKTRGLPAQKTIDAFYAAGYNDAALVELIALVSYNIFTNYFNHIAETEIDFPAYKKL